MAAEKVCQGLLHSHVHCDTTGGSGSKRADTCLDTASRTSGRPQGPPERGASARQSWCASSNAVRAPSPGPGNMACAAGHRIPALWVSEAILSAAKYTTDVK
eukprot:SM000091S24636  [mRNA]  locus=s91:431480:431885:- [translate_table: standard]